MTSQRRVPAVTSDQLLQGLQDFWRDNLRLASLCLAQGKALGRVQELAEDEIRILDGHAFTLPREKAVKDQLTTICRTCGGSKEFVNIVQKGLCTPG